MNKLLKLIDKYIFLYLILCFLVASIISYCFIQGTVLGKLKDIIIYIICMLFIRYGMYFILWFQLKNSMCPKKFLIFGTWFFIIISFACILGTLINTINNYHENSAFWGLLATSSAFSGAVRFKVKNNDKINEKL